jgi:hypothetical protein
LETHDCKSEKPSKKKAKVKAPKALKKQDNENFQATDKWNDMISDGELENLRQATASLRE